MEFGKIITVDFDKKEGKIKPLAALNAGPVHDLCTGRLDLTSDFMAMNIPAVRLSDIEPPYGKNQFVDVHCIFPDPSADPDDPSAYNFTETDRYVEAVRAAGAEPIIRLGESLDGYARKLYVRPPRDLEKWASVCEHIILHYNEGFADGYKWKLRRVEIWNLPELDSGWQGSEEELFALYSVTAKRLKARFPKLKVGGYGSLGFSGMNRLTVDEVYKNAPAYAERFLAYIKRDCAPLDFFSWYCYADSPEELTLHTRYARSALDGHGFKRTASYIVGFNMSRALSGVYRGYAADLLASYVIAERSGVELMVLDDARPYGKFNTLYTLEGEGARFSSARSALFAFGRLYALGTAVESLGDSRREVYSLAARGASGATVAVAVREYSGKLEIRLKNADYSSFTVRRLYEDESGAPLERKREDIPLGGNKIAVSVERGDIYLLEFRP